MRPRHDTPPDLRSASYMGHDLGVSFHTAFAVQRQRADFQAQPPERQRETMERVRQNVAAHPDSWLAKHWPEIYRLKGEW